VTSLLAAFLGGFHDPVAGHASDFFSYLVDVYLLGCFLLAEFCGRGGVAGLGGFALLGSGLLVGAGGS
jgi:hypothetical protein